jgi:phosphatidylglycerophosphatase C
VVTTKSPSEVTAEALLAELQEETGAIALDGDGTLWSGDVGEDFFYGILDSGRVSDLAAAELVRIAQGAGIYAGGSPAEVARRIYDAYLAGRFDEQHVCEIMAWICAGWSAGDVAAFVKDTVKASFASRIHPEVATVIAGARELELDVYVVSASPRPIVEAAAAVAGIAAPRVLAATAVLEGDRFATAVHQPIPYGAGKASALQRALGTVPLLAAFGDNAFDTEMLTMARRPIGVRPKPRLLALAPAIPSFRVLTAGV